MQRWLVCGVLTAACMVGGCRDNGGQGRTPGSDGGAEDRDESAPDAEEGWSADCPEAAFSMMTCVGSIEGARCPGTVHCECGAQVTPCVCEPYEAGYHFVCEDDCEAACAEVADPEEDGGVDSGPPPGPVSCDDFCAPQHAAGCASTVPTCESDCESIEAMVPEECREAWDDVKRCTASAEMACNGSGVPFPVGCDEATEAMASCIGL